MIFNFLRNLFKKKTDIQKKTIEYNLTNLEDEGEAISPAEESSKEEKIEEPKKPDDFVEVKWEEDIGEEEEPMAKEIESNTTEEEVVEEKEPEVDNVIVSFTTADKKYYLAPLLRPVVRAIDRSSQYCNEEKLKEYLSYFPEDFPIRTLVPYIDIQEDGSIKLYFIKSEAYSKDPNYIKYVTEVLSRDVINAIKADSNRDYKIDFYIDMPVIYLRKIAISSKE